MKKIEKLLNELLRDTSFGLSKDDIKNANDLIAHNEFGVAFELICAQLYENDAELSCDLMEEIKKVGALMEIDDDSWNYLV